MVQLLELMLHCPVQIDGGPGSALINSGVHLSVMSLCERLKEMLTPTVTLITHVADDGTSVMCTQVCISGACSQMVSQSLIPFYLSR